MQFWKDDSSPTKYDIPDKVIYRFNFTSENINETDRVFEMLTYQLAPQPLPIWGQQHHTGSQQRSNLDYDDGSCFMQVETASSVLRLNIMSPFDLMMK